MEPIDKFGNPIYPRIYKRLLRIGDRLIRLGFREAKKKPNLFYKTDSDYMVYADMRGTDIVKIWEDPCPMFYIRPKNDEWPLWKKNRIWGIEMDILRQGDIPFRLSFYEQCEMDDMFEWIYEEPSDSRRGTFNMFYDDRGPDGYCRCCSKDFQDNGYHCSAECEQREWRRYMASCMNHAPKCHICGVRLMKSSLSEEIEEEFDVILKEPLEHHVSYFPEEKIFVCPSCHSRIHTTDEYPLLKPPLHDADKFYYRKKES